MTVLMALAIPSKRVDSHQHFWRYSEAEFGWIDNAMAGIRRDFLPSDLKPLLDQSEVSATVAVQARQSLEETEWLLSLAAESPWIAGVVGWVPLVQPEVSSTLEELASNKRLKGVRHVLQAEPDEYMERAGFNSGLRALRKFDLAYDLLVLEHQLPAAIALVDRHPDQRFVLDHLAKPRIAAHELEPWLSNIRRLAEREHVSCKLSGMVTEASFERWKPGDLLPYAEAVLEGFGPNRLMFGSDWPVCTVASRYSRWVDTVLDFLGGLSESEENQIMASNAVEFYRLRTTH